MADSHLGLAPLIEPPLHPVPVAGATDPGQTVVLVALPVLLLLAVALWWWRRAPWRALRRIARQPEALLAAEQLARWQRQYQRQATPDWLSALDRLRFGPAEESAHDLLQQLCDEAATFTRPRP